MRTNILLIGADRNTVETLDFLLESRGYTVTDILLSGGSFDLSDEAARADLLILDVERPGETGLDIPGMLAERKLHPPVLVISSRAGRAGDGEVRIEKPIRADRFLRTVEELLRRKKNP